MQIEYGREGALARALRDADCEARLFAQNFAGREDAWIVAHREQLAEKIALLHEALVAEATQAQRAQMCDQERVPDVGGMGKKSKGGVKGKC